MSEDQFQVLNDEIAAQDAAIVDVSSTVTAAAASAKDANAANALLISQLQVQIAAGTTPDISAALAKLAQNTTQIESEASAIKAIYAPPAPVVVPTSPVETTPATVAGTTPLVLIGDGATPVIPDTPGTSVNTSVIPGDDTITPVVPADPIAVDASADTPTKPIAPTYPATINPHADSGAVAATVPAIPDTPPMETTNSSATNAPQLSDVPQITDSPTAPVVPIVDGNSDATPLDPPTDNSDEPALLDPVSSDHVFTPIP